MFWEQSVQYALLSDIGFRRQNNQDSCAAHLCQDLDIWRQRGHLFMVADGMGGHAVGELASKIAVDTIPHTFQKLPEPNAMAALKAAVEAANQAIHDRGTQNRDFLRMGTTCTVLVLGPPGVTIAHVGDSRAYRVRQGRIDQLTADHSLAWELMKQKRGRPDETAYRGPRNVITRSLGPEATVQVDVEGPFPVLPGDVYLLCSDGLTNHVNDREIGMIAAELPPAEACRLLVHLANSRGGLDNITVVIARVGASPEGAVPLPHSAEGLSWWSLAAFTLIAALVALGSGLALLTEWLIFGGFLAGGAIAALVAWLLIGWIRHPGRSGRGERDKTILWRAYRTASARMEPDFLQNLAATEAELRRAAQEEGWPVDWAEHKAASERAQSAMRERRYGEALRDFGRALDLIMGSIHQQRRVIQQEISRGKTADERATKPADEVSGRSP